MNNTIPFKSTSRTIRSEQITVDVGILSVLNHAASPGRRELDSNIYLAAIAPDMELNIIMEEDAKLLLPLSLTELHILKEYGTSDQLETCMALKLLVDRCQISNPYAAINARVAIERLSPKQYLRFFASLESLKV